MVKKKKTKFSNSRLIRSRNKRRRNKARSLPSLSAFNRVLSNTIYRGSREIQYSVDSMIVTTFTCNSILNNWSKALLAFKEMKVKKINFWFSTYNSTFKDGMIATIIAPKDEVDPNLTWTQFNATPGVMTRKVYQTTKGVYFPTEPSERDWFPTSTSKQLLVVCFMVHGIPVNPPNVAPPKLLVTWDAHVMFRGRSIDDSDTETEVEVVRSRISDQQSSNAIHF